MGIGSCNAVCDAAFCHKLLYIPTVKVRLLELLN